MQTDSHRDNLLTTEEAAEFLGVQPDSLATWRYTRKVRLPHIRIGRAVRYRREDLERFLQAATVDPVQMEG